MKKVLLIVLLIFLLFLGFIGLRFGSALTQEGNPIPYLIAISKNELSNSGYEEVLETSNNIRYVSKYEKDYPFIKEYMKMEGWEFKEQMGSGFLFVKNKEEIVIGTRQYSRHNIIWDVPKEIVD